MNVDELLCCDAGEWLCRCAAARGMSVGRGEALSWARTLGKRQLLCGSYCRAALQALLGRRDRVGKGYGEKSQATRTPEPSGKTGRTQSCSFGVQRVEHGKDL